MSTGAVLGGAAGIAWCRAWSGSPPGAYAVVGAAAMLGAAMQAPLTGLAMMLELTVGEFGVIVPMIAAVVTATAVARYVDGYSIYTARLRARLARGPAAAAKHHAGDPDHAAAMARSATPVGFHNSAAASELRLRSRLGGDLA